MYFEKYNYYSLKISWINFKIIAECLKIHCNEINVSIPFFFYLIEYWWPYFNKSQTKKTMRSKEINRCQKRNTVVWDSRNQSVVREVILWVLVELTRELTWAMTEILFMSTILEELSTLSPLPRIPMKVSSMVLVLLVQVLYFSQIEDIFLQCLMNLSLIWYFKFFFNFNP